MSIKALLNGNRVFASDVSGTSIYQCCECNDPMHYVKASLRSDGVAVTAHFAHNPGPQGQQRNCSASKMSEEHMNGQETIRLFAPAHFDWLKGADVDTEHWLCSENNDIQRRADVWFGLRSGHQVVFEIQFTKISRREIAERTRDYHKLQCHVIWCWPEKRDDLYTFCKRHFYCVGRLTDDGTEADFFGRISPFRYGPGLKRPFDPEVLPPFVPTVAEVTPFPTSTFSPTQQKRIEAPTPDAERDRFWNDLYKSRWEDARPIDLSRLVISQEDGPWATVPRPMRSIVHAYINSEQPQDYDRAIELCTRYGLDYQSMRKIILDEMIARSRTQNTDELRRIA